MAGETSLADNQWHHIGVVLGPSESPRVQDVRIYIDGRLEPANRIFDGPIDTLAGADVRFGMRAGPAVLPDWTPFNGLLDELRIDGRALTAEEIAELATLTQ